MITPNFVSTAASNHASAALPNTTAVFFNPNSKDTGWLTLDVCREFTRNKCSRADHQCRFAHPTPNVEIQNGKVTCCFDSIKGKCQRKDPPCKYLHPPQHLKEQLLQNGRNNLLLRHHQMQLVNSVLQQQQHQHHHHHHQQQQHLLTASPAIYPLLYDANGNKAYGSNPVAIAPISDGHFYTTPYLQQGLFYAPYATPQQHLHQQFNVLQSEPTPLYNCPPGDVTNPPGSPIPSADAAQSSTSSQHLENQNSVPVSNETPSSSKHEANKMSGKTIQYYPTITFNPYANINHINANSNSNNNNNNNNNNTTTTNNNNNNNGNNDNNNNYFSCQQMAYATIAPGFPFPIATAILPRY